jgi:hypothetical protein
MKIMMALMVIDGGGCGGCDGNGHEGDKSSVDEGCDDVNVT